MTSRPLDSAFMKHLGIVIDQVSPGRAELRVALSSDVLNGDGIAHGGLIATLADSAAGVAVYSLLDDSLVAVTTDLHITYLRPTTQGKLSATAEVIHRGARFLRIAMNVVQEQHLVATCGASRPRLPGGAQSVYLTPSRNWDPPLRDRTLSMFR
jgi:uncharacterized protein (TIGR00369 family)